MVPVPVTNLIIGYGGILLCIIIVGRVLECVVCELDEFRDGLKGKIIDIKFPMCIFINSVICPNPRQELIYPHVAIVNIQIHNSIFSFLVYLDMGIIKVLFLVVRFSCTCKNVVLDQSMGYKNAVFLGIFRIY